MIKILFKKLWKSNKWSHLILGQLLVLQWNVKKHKNFQIKSTNHQVKREKLINQEYNLKIGYRRVSVLQENNWVIKRFLSLNLNKKNL